MRRLLPALPRAPRLCRHACKHTQPTPCHHYMYRLWLLGSHPRPAAPSHASHTPALPQEGGIDLASLLDEEGFYVRERRLSAPIRWAAPRMLMQRAAALAQARWEGVKERRQDLAPGNPAARMLTHHGTLPCPAQQADGGGLWRGRPH